MAVLRLALPWANLPATTALASLRPEDGQRQGLAAGGNVLGAVDSVCSRLFNLSNTYCYVLYFVQLRIAKVKRNLVCSLNST